MFGGGYREREAEARVHIPNIGYGTFTAMMRYIYTGACDADLPRNPSLARDLLRAADQYLLDGLKALCESALAACLTPRCLSETFELSEAYSAPQLARRCALFALEQADALLRPPSGGSGRYAELMARMAPVLRAALGGELVRQHDAARAASAARRAQQHQPQPPPQPQPPQQGAQAAQAQALAAQAAQAQAAQGMGAGVAMP